MGDTRTGPPRGRSPVMATLNISRSSAVAIASASAPMSSTSKRSSTPCSSSSIARLRPGLTAEGGQHRVGPLLLDDLLENPHVERLDIGRIREIRVGHDRRRVRVGEDDPIALLTQDPARLRARVVELTGLTDHYGPGADDQDRRDVSALGHEHPSVPRTGRRGSGCRGGRGPPRGGTAH